MTSPRFLVPLDTTNILESFGKGNFCLETEINVTNESERIGTIVVPTQRMTRIGNRDFVFVNMIPD
jgi:hypothetical protein